MMAFIGSMLIFALQIYSFIIILEVLINWLIVFEVINIRNDKAQNLLRVLKKLTDPLYSVIRKYIPPVAGIDLTPLVVLLGIHVLQRLIGHIFMGYGGWYW
jgi:YggT family protein